MTPEEIVQFKEQGWIVKRGLIPKDELTPWVKRSWVRRRRDRLFRSIKTPLKLTPPRG